MRKAALFLYVPFIFGLVACEDRVGPARRGAIIFGDSSMIVTETDPKYLNDNVADFRPKPAPIAKDSSLPAAGTAVAPPTTTPEPQQTPEAPPASVSKGIQIDIPGVVGSEIDWAKKRGVSVSVDEGALKGKSLIVSGLSDVKVQQREQSVVMLRLRRQGLVKLSLPGDYSAWENLKGKNGRFSIEQNRAKYDGRISSGSLRSAAQRAAKSMRLNRRDTDELIRSLRNVRSADQRPLEPAIQSVIWRIDGKDPDGKSVHRELRVDIKL